MSAFIPLDGWGVDASPFHIGELDAQRRAGVSSQAESAGRRGIRRYMPEQHRRFFAEQPFIVVGGVDANGQPWATLRAGVPGFVSSPDAKTLRIDGGVLPGDPLRGQWSVGAMIGGLGLQPQTRRRNRINGRLRSVDGDTLLLHVTQSFGNCAKYIQSRTPTFVERDASLPSTPEVATQLSDADRALLMRADTFFIASANLAQEAGLARGVDVSHRGGAPGFVRIDDANTLTTPDYSGNRFFNTIGNLIHDPRAGLLFIDFATGDLLYLAVRAEVVWDGAELAAFEGAERLVRFHIGEVRRTRGALPFRWSDVEFAPQFATRPASAVRQTAGSARASSWQKLKVARVVEETPSIRSFYFEAIDGAPLPPFKPGQFLPIRVPVPGLDAPLLRTYTLSDSHDARRYRISVKREGVASNWLHDHLGAGMQIEAKQPRGTFIYDEDSPRSAVLISAGIGITPMMAMLRHAAHSTGNSDARAKRVFFFHGARSDRERPFSAHLKEIAMRYPSASVHLFNSAGDGLADGVSAGRVSIDALKRELPFDDYDFYLCGPESFMREMYEGLRGLNVADERIRFEAFGPANITRTSGKREIPAAESITPEAGAVPVTFARSMRTVQWSPRDGSLLEFAEAHGVEARSNCRSGTCGTCSTRLLSGDVRYDGDVEAEIAPGHALICVGRPVKKETGAAVVLDM
jgi:ferredoxin-NADP reductase/predicted pyridoxine 5'-phosphate oxidase superfamily flavin-nucleotide-binding protein